MKETIKTSSITVSSWQLAVIAFFHAIDDNLIGEFCNWVKSQAVSVDVSLPQMPAID
ncbi:MAG: hypothetical protein HQ450_01735 [Alcaligenaceae bacterium]|nr:hypothetical protein [Alcaligenaceae bacterium]